MIYLLLTIILTVSLLIIFKLIGYWKVNGLVAVVVNYIICVLLGSFLIDTQLFSVEMFHQSWVQMGIFLGIIFIVIFNLIGVSTSKAGMAVTAIANKLSLVIPVSLAFYLYDDSITLIKISGIIIALISIYMAIYKHSSSYNVKMLTYPFIVFLGSGLIDTCIKYTQHHWLSANQKNEFLILIFFTAAVLGIVYLIIKHKKNKITIASILIGLLLGIVNYGSVYFLLKTLEQWDSSYAFTINNIGIVMVSGIIAHRFFNEKLSRTNLIGMLLAIVAIALISF